MKPLAEPFAGIGVGFELRCLTLAKMRDSSELGAAHRETPDRYVVQMAKRKRQPQ